MDKELLQIRDFATKILQDKFGYCGVASGDADIMLNSSTKDGKDITIIIKVRDED